MTDNPIDDPTMSYKHIPVTDELKRIKERAVERRRNRVLLNVSVEDSAEVNLRKVAAALGATETDLTNIYLDLDRAITIAEEKQIVFNMMMDSRVEVSTGEAEQLREAIERIVQLAERSDAHPDVDILSVAREALR